MTYHTYPLFHPKSTRAAPLALTQAEFRAAFPGESDLVEFKTGIGRQAIQRVVTAFSNSSGGVLLIGVDDEGGVVGRSLTPGAEDEITRAILAVHNPGRYWLYQLDVAGKPVTVVAVAERGQGFAQSPDGLVLVRRSAHTVPLVGGELLQHVTGRSLVRFDSTATSVPMADASPELLDQIRLAFAWRKGPTTDRLENEGLVTSSDGQLVLTVAGALTLLPDPAERLGKAYVEVLRYPSDGVNYDKRIEVRGSVQRQVEQATELVMAELGTNLVVSGVRRYELPKLPEEVVREAIANAVAHRSYEELGRAVRVEIHRESVVIESPGGFPEPVTEANIRETQSARNISVIRVLRRLRLAEDSGRGIDVMEDSMAAALLDPPQFKDVDHSVRVVLPITGPIAPQERAWIVEVERRGRIRPRDPLILVHAARGEELTNERVRELLNVDSRDARATLKRLRDGGFLRQVGERGGARYVLAPQIKAPASFRLSADALGELVLALAQEGPITNATVRDATGLDRTEALRILERLVSDGRLDRIGERRGTRYMAATDRTTLKLIFSSTTDPMQRPENVGFSLNPILDTLERLQLAGYRIDVVDTSDMSDRDRYELYLAEAVMAAGNRYRVRRVFGSNNHPGEDFGEHVPALLVLRGPNDRPTDVYPHETTAGGLVTIASYLHEAVPR